MFCRIPQWVILSCRFISRAFLFCFFNRFYFTFSDLSLQITYFFDWVSVSPWFWKYIHFSEVVQFFSYKLILAVSYGFLYFCFHLLFCLFGSSFLSFQRNSSWFHWRLFPNFLDVYFVYFLSGLNYFLASSDFTFCLFFFF